MIVCAAVRLKMKSTGNEVVLCGVRHASCFEQLAALNIHHDQYEVIDEGFMTHRNVFINRTDAWHYANACGQLSVTAQVKTDCKGTLYSEDLW